MSIQKLVAFACDKEHYASIDNYCNFAKTYLEFIKSNLQAVIVSRNEHHYQFFQYQRDGTFNVTRPINSQLMYSLEEFEVVLVEFQSILTNIKNEALDNPPNREILNRIIYTAQQCIGATLDALPAKKSNTARKINGDLFERFIRPIINEVGVDVTHGVVSVPVTIDGEIAFTMNYQHDLIIKSDADVRAIGSVKTSSKDRLGKMFVDKFLYNRLTN